MRRRMIAMVFGVVLCMAITGMNAWAQGQSTCAGMPSWSDLRGALIKAVKDETSGLNLNMWATVVARDGTVCAVAFSGDSAGAQWLASRVISAQKANTANSLSLDKSSYSATTDSGKQTGLALSTANLYSAVQPGGSLFGLQFSNPVDAEGAYAGSSRNFGRANDPLVGTKVGGVNVFGGGLGLYTSGQALIGGVGVSGDTSCADHMIAWRVRNNLGLDHLAGVGGVSGDNARPDNIVYDITANPSGGTGNSSGGFGHPKCINTADEKTLPAVQP